MGVSDLDLAPQVRRLGWATLVANIGLVVSGGVRGKMGGELRPSPDMADAIAGRGAHGAKASYQKLAQLVSSRGIQARAATAWTTQTLDAQLPKILADLAAMPPKLLNDEGDVHVLRPLAHVAEADCARFARAMKYPIISCDLCGSQDGLQRRQIKAMLDRWEAESPGRRQVLFRALTQVNPGHLLDPALFDFKAL